MKSVSPAVLQVLIVEGAAEELHARAHRIAGTVGLPVGAPGELCSPSERALVLTAKRLEFRGAVHEKFSPLYVDFVSGATALRRVLGVSRRLPLARAVGVRAPLPNVLDATAGLGRDTFLLAALGCRVIAMERSPVLAALLWDGLERARTSDNPALRRVIDRITLVFQDARVQLRESAAGPPPDVVYLDPMYPEDRRTALAGKELRICRELVGDDADAAELLELARIKALKRTVVKRHRNAPPLAGVPDVEFAGRSVRYDVYLRPGRRGE